MKSVTRYLLATTAVAGILGSVAVSRATLEAATATATLTIQASVSQQCTVSNALDSPTTSTIDAIGPR